jgi:hypothetical protein
MFSEISRVGYSFKMLWDVLPGALHQARWGLENGIEFIRPASLEDFFADFGNFLSSTYVYGSSRRHPSFMVTTLPSGKSIASSEDIAFGGGESSPVATAISRNAVYFGT